MNGKTSSLSKKFRQVFHIPAVKRGPTRELVTELQVRARKLPRNKEVVEILAQLEIAARQVFDKLKVNDETARTNAVEAAKGICAKMDPLIAAEELKFKNSGGTAKTVTLTTKTPVDGSTEIAKTLKGLVKAELTRIESLSDTSGGKQRVLMPKDAWTITGLNGQAHGVTQQIDAEVMDTAREKALRQQIDVLKLTVQAALDYAAEAKKLPNLMEPLVQRAQALKTRLLKNKAVKAEQLPFVAIADRLASAVYEADLLNPPGIHGIAESLEKALLEAESKPDDYIANGSERARRIEVEKKAYDDLVKAPLEQLRVLAEPLRMPTYGVCVLDVTKEQAALLDLSKPCPVGEGARLAGPRKTEIERNIRLATEEATGLRKQLKTDFDALKLSVTGIEATRPLKVLRQDWQAIDAGMSSLTSMMPAPDAPLAQVIGAVASVGVLVKQLAAHVKKVKDQEGDAKLFEQKYADLRLKMKAAMEKKAPLKRWDEKNGAELTSKRHKLNDSLGKISAADALQTLTDITKDFEAKLKPAEDAQKYLTESEEKLRGWFLAYNLAANAMDGGVPPPRPNAMENALDAWSAAEKARPVNLDAMKAAVGLCITAFKDLDKRSVGEIAGDTHQKLADEEKDKKGKDKAMRAKLEERRYGLAAQAKLARNLVKAAKGDSTEIDRVDELLSTAKEQIKAGDEEAANRTLRIIGNRIGLIQANPAGEPTRRRDELQALYDDWTRAVTTARNNLAVVVGLINEHAKTLPPGEIGGRVTTLGKAMSDYAATFATEPTQLRPAFEALADPATPDAGQRKARETALAFVSEALSRMKAHPLTTELARSPVPAARLVPGLLVRTLDRMNYSVSIAVE